LIFINDIRPVSLRLQYEIAYLPNSAPAAWSCGYIICGPFCLFRGVRDGNGETDTSQHGNINDIIPHKSHVAIIKIPMTDDVLIDG